MSTGTWVLALYVFLAGDPTPKGITLGGIESKAECEHRAAADTKRVAQSYPASAGVEQLQWECFERRSSKESTKPGAPA